MKKTIITSMIFFSSLVMAETGGLNFQNIPGQQELQGDQKLSCEAILCLSTSSRPGECQPSIAKYFSIVRKTSAETMMARRDFLLQCPAVYSDTKMASLVNVINSGADKCTASKLNSSQQKYVTVRECKEVPTIVTGQKQQTKEVCVDKRIKIIDNKLPRVCSSYTNHEYTDVKAPHYEGDPLNGGKWID